MMGATFMCAGRFRSTLLSKRAFLSVIMTEYVEIGLLLIHTYMHV